MNLSTAKAISISGKSTKSIAINGRIVWTAGETPSPPSNVHYISWIAGNGSSAYIDTGVYPDINTEIYMECTIGSNNLFGARDNLFKYVNVREYFAKASSGFGAPGFSQNYLSHDIVIQSSGDILKASYLDGTMQTSITWSDGNCGKLSVPLTLFAQNNNGSIEAYSSNKIYVCKLYDGETLIRDFRPCLDEAGVPCLWDEVLQSYYRNAGKGSFVYKE